MNFVKPANSNPLTRTSFDHSWSCPNSSTFVQFDCCHILADVTWHLCNFNHDFLQCLNAITTQTKSFLVHLSLPNYYVKCSLLLCNLLWSSLPCTQLTHVQIQSCSSNGLAGTSFCNQLQCLPISFAWECRIVQIRLLNADFLKSFNLNWHLVKLFSTDIVCFLWHSTIASNTFVTCFWPVDCL